MLQITIWLLLASSVGILAYKIIPAFMQGYSRSQTQKMETAVKSLGEMFIFTEKHRMLQIFTLTPLSLGLIGFILTRSLLGWGIGIAVGLLLPRIIIKNLSLQRRNKFQSQLVDGLMVLSSSLRAGMSLTQAFEVLVEEMPPPIRDEFALTLRENQMGVSLEDCLDHLRQRMPVDELDLISTAISIARETGGDLTEIFSQLVNTMRETKKLEGRVKALTVQGRLQGIIMMILPIAFGIFIYFVNPQSIEVMLTDPLGRTLLIWGIISQGIGMILIRKFSKVEV